MQFTFCVAPRCPRGSLVPYQNEENQFHPVLASLGAGAPMPTATIFTECEDETFQWLYSIGKMLICYNILANFNFTL